MKKPNLCGSGNLIVRVFGLPEKPDHQRLEEKKELQEEIERLRHTNERLGRELKELRELKDHYRETARELKSIREKLKQLSITDDLTKVYNHRFLMDCLKLEFKRAERCQYPISLMMLDIDRFKTYNDTHGHMAGDRVLRRIADILKETVRQTDILARYGGEEFAVILIRTTLAEAYQIAERVRKAVEGFPIEHGETQPKGRLTVSVGVSTLTRQVSSIETLVKTADDALYEAKRMGRNRVAVDRVVADQPVQQTGG